MTKKKRGSSSVYRTGTDSVKIRLIVLTVLAALLLLTALCAKYICPYDPYVGKAAAGAGASAGNRPLWTGYAFQDSDRRNYQYFFHPDPGEHYNSNGNLCGNYLRLAGRAFGWFFF